jgi:protein-L-isoaspartate(D-aspartate) O-methyltransferase
VASDKDSLSRIGGLRAELVNALRRQGLLKSARVEAAFRNVPRHLFVPGVDPDHAYSDQSISVKEHEGVSISSSSQPAIMALMLEQLGVQPGQRVLEIGAGTGYNAALLAYLVGDSGRVVSIDIDQELVEAAQVHLAAAGMADRVEVIADDGGYGHPEGAPYDRIMVTASAWDITPSWWTQLRRGGRLVAPVSLRGAQVSVAFENRGAYLESLSVEPCGFMELRGEFASPFAPIVVRLTDRIVFLAELPDPPDGEAIRRWLTSPTYDLDTGIEVRARDIGRGLEYWLALHEPGFCRLLASGEAASSGLVPPLFGYTSGRPARFSPGVASESGLCVMMRSPIQKGIEDLMSPQPFRLWLRAYGDDPTLAERVAETLRGWEAAGRLGSEAMRLRLYPAQRAPEPTVGEIMLPKRWTKFIIHWPRKS